jgi:hypothetical protein
MANLEKTIQEALVNLPKEYRKAVNDFGLTAAVEEIADRQSLNEEQTHLLDKEVTMFILGIQDTAKFMVNIEDGLDLPGERVAEITTNVTEKILQPIQNKLPDNDEPPVPQPPGSQSGQAPETSYGGASDPYREPTDE